MTLIYILGVVALSVGSLALYDSGSDVVDLTESNFDRLVTQSDQVWVVEFYAPWCGHCQQFVGEYSKAAKALKGVVKVGAVNADEHKSLGGRFGVRGFPTVKIFGANKNKPEDYNGGRTAQGLVDAAVSAAKSKVYAQLGGKSGGGGSSSKGDPKDVVELTDSNFDELVLESEDMWLVEFFAPWCGHCKNLAPHWAQAATELKGKVKLGAVDATVHQVKASRYGVQGYPTIKFFAPGKKDSSSVEDYNGGRTANDIVNWALDKLAENVPAPEIKQLVDDKTLKEACEEHPLCVVSVLPHILDCQADCRNSYLNILKEMGEKYKKKMWGWVWSEAGSQPEVENMLEIGGFGYPAMAVLNAKKMKYSILRGSFSSEGINEFLRDLSFGRGNTAPVKGASFPQISAIEPWDGKDGELPPDEDIDLSDVQLDDLPKDEL
ncbi:protein disulfide-isomerase A6 homolog isoform X1 [Homalodisca vitripennis]|uniref:protein disulfide-isomerase A6 homolog isoform X1 n=2 Tax=Homalodisca vitripennis TaxID=197043 RepID=UPI001EE9B29F|nr:protein disulfide-isomerase A6 homolog isoform X1 [Homalodisca vitripennis]KAG8263473.1 Protein disulfide-isomerase A6 [Homalodisca vitripennis]